MVDLEALFSGAPAPAPVALDPPVPVDDLVEAAAGRGWATLVVTVGDKAATLEAFAEAGRFPDWVGRNWDALQDALGDLSWLGPVDGYLVVLRGTAGVEPDPVLDSVLARAATEWADRGTPFVTVVE